MKIITFLCGLFIAHYAISQNYTSFFTGDTTDVSPDPEFGILLAGGATDNDFAMTWFLNRANGGDVLIIRASGADGYNDYLFSDLGVSVNSVETIRFENALAADDAYVLQQISRAEAIFIAGGDQDDYVDYWRDTPVEDLLNAHVNIKQAVIGGTSAGMAILGGHYFSAANGTVYSDEALENPYSPYMTIGHQDFLMLPFLENVITDSHYDDPDRRGRHLAFLARIYADGYPQSLGIGCNEYVATVIDENGVAYAYGEWPAYEEYVYFIRHGCQDTLVPETCEPGIPLTWNRNQTATYVCRIKATETGVNLFSLNDWMTWNGGDWQEWWVDNGTANFNEVSFGPPCFLEEVTSYREINEPDFDFYPTLCDDEFHLRCKADDLNYAYFIYDTQGRMVGNGNVRQTSQRFNISELNNGTYFFRYRDQVRKFTVVHN